MKDTIIKLLITLSIGVLVFGFIQHYSKEEQAQSDGSITFILVDENNEEVIHETLDFYEGDTLFDILNNNYNIVCADKDYLPDDTCSYTSPYGKAILTIEGVESTWYGSFLALYINDTYANYGVSKLPFKDGDTIQFIWTDLS